MSVWTCPGTVDHVHDGDTIIVKIDLGWHVQIVSAIRVDGLASPELSTDAGKAARDYAVKLLPPGAAVTVISKKLLGTTEKYGRCLADLTYAPDPMRPSVTGLFSQAMIAAGHGVAWDGTGKQPTSL